MGKTTSSTYLSPYEFTRVQRYIGRTPKSPNTNSKYLADKILKNHSNIRKTAEYQNTKSMYYECTMSCGHSEARAWLTAFMEEAINYGEVTKNLDWMDKFLAAYDILDDLKKSGY